MNARRLARWTVIVICLQIVLLGSLNTFLLSDKVSIKIKRSAFDPGSLRTVSRVHEVKTFRTPLEQDAALVQVSYDYGYAAFSTTTDGVERLRVLNLEGKGKPVDVDLPEDTTLRFIRWLPDRHRLFFIVSGERRGLTELQLWYHDVGLGKSGLVKAIEELPAESAPGLMSMSTFTNLIYLTIDTPYNGSYLYRIDIMGDCRKLRLRKRDIASLQVLPKNDVVYLEEGETGKVLVLLNGSITELEDRDYGTVRGRIIGVGQDEELVVAGYPDDEPSATVNRLVYADEEGRYLGMVGFATGVAADTVKVADNGEILRLGSMADGSISVKTQAKRQLWRVEGELLKVNRDNVAFVTDAGDGRLELVVKSRVAVGK